MPPQPTRYLLARAGRLTVWQSIGVRVAAVVFLLGVALAGHWIDRAGLRDNADGHVSFLDIVYFTTVTVTTVGYGDIVPVTPGARMFDSFVVTPIRLFVWLIFLGSAYSFVLQHSWQRIRARMIGHDLKDHYVICGFGAGGTAATQELLREGIDPGAIVVIDRDAARIEEARAEGVIVLAADATHNAALEAARVAAARSVLVSMGRDDTAALVVLSARQLNAAVPISVSIREVENEDLLRQAGATSVINPVSLGGHLLARSSTGPNAADYVRDLTSRQGRVVIRERPAATEEVGTSLAAIGTGRGLRLMRDGREIGFWEPAAARIAAGDTIVEIVPVTAA